MTFSSWNVNKIYRCCLLDTSLLCHIMTFSVHSCHYYYVALMLDSDKKEAAEPILYDTYTLIHTNQGSVIAFLNNLRKLHKIIQYNGRQSLTLVTQV